MARYKAKKAQYLCGGNEAAWQSTLPCACFVYALFMRNLVVAFHVLRRMRLKNRRTTGEMLVWGRSWWSIHPNHQKWFGCGLVAKYSRRSLQQRAVQLLVLRDGLVGRCSGIGPTEHEGCTDGWSFGNS
jgi:hypothetical protein